MSPPFSLISLFALTCPLPISVETIVSSVATQYPDIKHCSRLCVLGKAVHAPFHKIDGLLQYADYITVTTCRLTRPVTNPSQLVASLVKSRQSGHIVVEVPVNLTCLRGRHSDCEKFTGFASERNCSQRPNALNASLRQSTNNALTPIPFSPPHSQHATPRSALTSSLAQKPDTCSPLSELRTSGRFFSSPNSDLLHQREPTVNPLYMGKPSLRGRDMLRKTSWYTRQARVQSLREEHEKAGCALPERGPCHC